MTAAKRGNLLKVQEALKNGAQIETTDKVLCHCEQCLACMVNEVECL